MRTTYDMSPLFRTMIGFERVADLIDHAMQMDATDGYPPYNIEKVGDDAYRITVALAGFKPEELSVTAHPNELVVSGRKAGNDNGAGYIYRGIQAHDFERRFDLADHVVVKGARHEDGVLTIELEREIPEALKPRRIEIATGVKVQQLNQPQAKIEPQAA